MSDIFWLKDPTILFKNDKITQIWPYEEMTYNEKLNATTRFIILVSVGGYILMNNYLILLFGLILILLIVFINGYYKNEVKEGLQNMKNQIKDEEKHTRVNPLYNVMLNDYTDNPKKEAASTEYNEEKEELINHQVKNFIYENNKDNKDIGKIFDNLGNNLDFEKSMRQFHINPSTTIPNSQDDFLKYCYNDLYSEKPLLIY